MTGIISAIPSHPISKMTPGRMLLIQIWNWKQQPMETKQMSWNSPPCPFLLVCTEHSRLVHWVMLLPNWDLYLPCTDVDMLASSQAAVYQCFQKSCNTSWSQGMVAMQTLKCSHHVPPGSQQPWKNITQVSLEYHCVIPGGSETVTGTDTNCIVKLQGWIILNVSSQVKHIFR